MPTTFRNRLHGADDRGPTRHVELHILHAGGGLDRDAARVEREPLSDEHEWSLVLRSPIVLHDDQASLLLGADGHGEDGVHAFCEQSILVEHRDLEADLFTDAEGFLREMARRRNVAGP